MIVLGVLQCEIRRGFSQKQTVDPQKKDSFTYTCSRRQNIRLILWSLIVEVRTSTFQMRLSEE